jgi:(1->4)-alpha-D-glucan 1-alpha-D-glucosylmutase
VQIVRDAKLRIMDHEMASELNVLARDASRIARQNPRTADFTHNILHRALREIVACFPVYRTYVWMRKGRQLRPTDAILNGPSRRRGATKRTLIRVSSILRIGCFSGDLVSEPRAGFSREAASRCAVKFQQYSGPVMAKGLEDTAFYRYNRFIALKRGGRTSR